MIKSIACKSAVYALALCLTACSGPTVTQDFQEQVEAAPANAVPKLIKDEANKLGISALSLTILEGDGPPETHYFGRAKPDGLMQVASMSKSVAAAVILNFAAQKSVALDDDIRAQITSVDISKLEGGDRPVTLRQLLSHTTGSSQSGYPGYPRDYDVPTATDVITNPPRIFESAIKFDGEPGKFRYSGGGYVIAQIWAEDVSGKPFAALAQALVFDPLGMSQSTFIQPTKESDFAPLTIIGADSGIDFLGGIFSALDNSWHIYPEQAAAGLWTTSSDYAIFAAALVDAAYGAENAIPSKIAAEMIKPQAVPEDGSAYGLGTQLVLDEVSRLKYVSHSGLNAGYQSLYSVRPPSKDKPRRLVVSIANGGPAASLNQAVVYALTDK